MCNNLEGGALAACLYGPNLLSNDSKVFDVKRFSSIGVNVNCNVTCFFGVKTIYFTVFGVKKSAISFLYANLFCANNFTLNP